MNNIILNHYHKIDEMQTTDGTFALWESNRHGDTAKAVVTLNGEYLEKTWESLHSFYENEWQFC